MNNYSYIQFVIKRAMPVMASFLLFSIATLLMTHFSGCKATRVGTTLDPGTIGVDFTFKKINMCNGPSPEITLTNLPVGTVDLKVTLRDLDHPLANHGGGYLKNIYGHVIQTGALEGYFGPCPPKSHPFRPHYVFKVEAIDANGNVLEFGQAMRQCSWSDFE